MDDTRVHPSRLRTRNYTGYYSNSRTFRAGGILMIWDPIFPSPVALFSVECLGDFDDFGSFKCQPNIFRGESKNLKLFFITGSLIHVSI